MKSTRGKRRPSKSLLVIIIVLLLLFFSILAFILYDFNLITNPLAGIGKQEQRFEIRDLCSIIVGKLIHTMNDDGSCRIQCRAECEARTLNFVRIEFAEIENNCNKCTCYCR